MHPMLNTAVKAARKAGSIINRASLDVDLVKVASKGPSDFVTEVDRAAEQAIVDILLKAYPDHAILAEESGASGDSEYTWIIDPLDGTTNFIHGFPQYAVSIALRHREHVTQAVVFDPTRNELFTASRGRGAFLYERRKTLARKAADVGETVKTGRTHLMDAMPLTLAQEMGAWRTQVDDGIARLQGSRSRLHALALGGTAVGTGINAPPEFAARAAALLSRQTGLDLRPSRDFFASLAAQDTAVELSGQLRTLAVSLMKISNDLRWMNSGPLAGLGEIALPALQPGSSIMPGKVNPVVPEAVTMVAAQVIGNDVTVTVAGQSGAFQLNVMLPVIAYNLLQSIDLLANAAHVLARSAIAGFAVNPRQIAGALARNPMLVTALTPVIGYDLAAAIAKRALAEGRPIREVAAEMTDLGEERLAKLLDPADLTRGGVRHGRLGE